MRFQQSKQCFRKYKSMPHTRGFCLRKSGTTSFTIEVVLAEVRNYILHRRGSTSGSPELYPSLLVYYRLSLGEASTHTKEYHPKLADIIIACDAVPPKVGYLIIACDDIPPKVG